MENFSKTELENEKWKDIEGYDGMYQVSNLGRVRSKHSGEWRVLRPGKLSTGYLNVGLRKDGKTKTVSVHRLVVQAFIPNDNIFNDQVNHIDECKQNNRVSNLEYCTASYNVNYNGLRYRQPHPNYRRNEVKDLYDPNLSYRQNIELLKSKGIPCSKSTLQRLRKDLGLTKKNTIETNNISDIFLLKLCTN